MPISERIRQLNDDFRRTFIGGRVMLTPGVNALPSAEKAAVLATVRTFAAFDGDNDPSGEHDFGSFELGGDRFFFKIDYYDPNLEFGSEDPADVARTTRVLTVMFASEY